MSFDRGFFRRVEEGGGKLKSKKQRNKTSKVQMFSRRFGQSEIANLINLLNKLCFVCE
jgi:hypothetical protein